jgi:hypothetical protein
MLVISIVAVYAKNLALGEAVEREGVVVLHASELAVAALH